MPIPIPTNQAGQPALRSMASADLLTVPSRIPLRLTISVIRVRLQRSQEQAPTPGLAQALTEALMPLVPPVSPSTEPADLLTALT